MAIENKTQQVKEVLKAMGEIEKKKKEKEEQELNRKKRNQYKTNWFFFDMNDIFRTIFEMINTGLRNSRISRNKELLGQYVAFIAVSGCRRNEPFLYSPTVSKFIKGGETFYKITRLNEKNFSKGKARRRQVFSPIFMPREDRYEKALFEYLLNGKSLAKLNFSPLILSKKDNLSPDRFDGLPYEEKEALLEKRSAHITRIIKNTFRTKITNGHKIMEDEGVNPHILRHVRAYDLVINKGIKKEMVAKLLGWSDDKMVGYYSDIKNAMREEEMIGEYLRLGKRPEPPAGFQEVKSTESKVIPS